MNKDNNYEVARQYEDEIDLVELIKILLKNLRLIVGIIVIGTLLGISAGFYLKNSEPIRMEQRFSIVDYTEFGGRLVHPEDIFRDNQVVANFFASKNIADKVEGEEKLSLTEKRRVLEGMFVISKLGKNTSLYAVKVSDESLEENIKSSETFFLELNRYIEEVNKNLLNKTYIETLNRLETFKTQLEEIEKQIQVVSNNSLELLGEEVNAIDLVTVIKETNSKLFVEKDAYTELYNEVLREKYALEKALEKSKESINLNSSLYELDSKVNLKLISLISIILSLFFGIFIVFIKEFLKNIDWKN